MREDGEAEPPQILGVPYAGVGDQAAEPLGLAGVGEDIAERSRLGVRARGDDDDVARPRVGDGGLQHEVVARRALDGEGRAAQRHAVIDRLEGGVECPETALRLVDRGCREAAQLLGHARVWPVERGADANHGGDPLQGAGGMRSYGLVRGYGLRGYAAAAGESWAQAAAMPAHASVRMSVEVANETRKYPGAPYAEPWITATRLLSSR